jgi:hypothetical protein
MSLQFKKWSKIPQLAGIVKEVKFNHDFVGKDELGSPIYNNTTPYPTVEFNGTVKLHGTNAQISYMDGKIQTGKRSGLIKQDDLSAHFGFNQFVQVQNQQAFIDWFKVLETTYALKPEDQLIIYGEWAGEGVQKVVAVSELPKSFYIFGVKTIKDEVEKSWTVEELNPCPVERVYNITDFPKYSVEIDFNAPQKVQNQLIELTNAIDKECPVAKQLGIEGIGEGIVWVGHIKDKCFKFKTKGTSHEGKGGNVKPMIAVDPVVVQNIEDFVTHVVTEGRVQQAMHETGSTTRKDTRVFITWLQSDIQAEEKDVLADSGLEYKQVAKQVSDKARRMFFAKLDTLETKD